MVCSSKVHVMVAQLVTSCDIQTKTKNQDFIFPFIDIPRIGFLIVSIKKRKNLSLSCGCLFHPSKTSKVITIITVKKWVFNFCENRPGSRNKVSEAISGEKWGEISTFFLMRVTKYLRLVNVKTQTYIANCDKIILFLFRHENYINVFHTKWLMTFFDETENVGCI